MCFRNYLLCQALKSVRELVEYVQDVSSLRYIISNICTQVLSKANQICGFKFEILVKYE